MSIQTVSFFKTKYIASIIRPAAFPRYIDSASQ